MAIVVEDGSVVSGANSFVTRAEFIAYALARGVTVTDDSSADITLIKATDFIASHEANLKGTLVDKNQSTPFPRYDIGYIDGYSWGSSEIPRQVILCQLAVALEINAGVDVYNTPANPNLIAKSKRVEGAVSIEYAVDGSGQKLSRTSRYDSLLNSLLKNTLSLSIPMVRA